MTLKISWTYRWADLPWLIVTALAYALFAKVILAFYAESSLVSVFWPADGVALAAVLLGGRRYLAAV